MKIQASTFLAFGTVQVTVLVVALYVLVLTLSLGSERWLESAPEGIFDGVNVTAAWEDLLFIAASPHPYNSRRNEAVRAYIIDRVSEAVGARVVDDREARGAWSILAETGAYVESGNVYVVVDGREPDLSAVLFSAHFDSVPTAPGATDNGMGVASLIQLVHYFAANQPRRTVVFNFNNGEEDGLYGAKVFLTHKLSSLPSTFLNLEGGGSGGRPILFRASSHHVMRTFHSGVSRLLGSTASSDAFASGLIRSRTDFSVYESQGMKGLDLAFYARRSKYHTVDDSVEALGGMGSLWSMLRLAIGGGKALAEALDGGEEVGRGVYFDLYSQFMVVTSFDAYFAFNVALLLLGPVLVAYLLKHGQATGKLKLPVRGWYTFPVTGTISLSLTILLGTFFASSNTFVISTHPILLLIGFLSFTTVVTHAPSHLPTLWPLYFLPPSPLRKIQVQLHTLAFWWVLVLVNLGTGVGGLYFITVCYTATLTALVIGIADALRTGQKQVVMAVVEGDHLVPVEQSTVSTPPIMNVDDGHEHVSETTPLLGSRAKPDPGSPWSALWIIELLVLIPVPVAVLNGVLALVLSGMGQTLTDGSPALILYVAVALLTWLMTLPLAPFATKLHTWLFASLTVLCLLTTFVALIITPFSASGTKFKVYFSQSVDLARGTSEVAILGVEQYLRDVIGQLPSTQDVEVKISSKDSPPGLMTARWSVDGPMLPSPGAGGRKVEDLLEWDVQVLHEEGQGGVRKARFAIRCLESKAARLYFDQPISTFVVSGEVPYKKEKDAKDLKIVDIFTRDWEKEVEVVVEWPDVRPEGSRTEGGAAADRAVCVDEDAKKGRMTGRVACRWHEIAPKGTVPVLDELMEHKPDWVAVSGRGAVVEGWKRFDVRV